MDSNGEHNGIDILYNPENATIDIVFVHGLNGDRERTWTSDRKTNPPSVFWIKTMLPDDCPSARIMTFGYDAEMSLFMTGSTTQTLSIYTVAKDLINSLVRERRAANRQDYIERPIIFVAHSLGGLVVKQAVIDSLSDVKKERIAIARFTRGVLFFGTPHRGAPGLLVKVAKKVLAVLGSENRDILRVLEARNTELEQLHRNFMSATTTLEVNSIMNFREGLFTKGLGEKVVADTSTYCDDPQWDSDFIHADHQRMCKFYQRTNDYKKVIDALLVYVEKASHWNQERIEKLKPSLPISSIPYVENNRFVCRAAILEEVTQKLSGSDQVQKRVVLQGPGGIGKSSIALKYAYSALSQDTSAFWINASTKESIVAGLRNTLLSLKIKAPVDHDIESNALRVKKWLENKRNGDWVLVIDNADDTALHFQDILPNCKHGSVVFTSRDRRLAPQIGAIEVVVGLMTLTEATELYWNYRKTLNSAGPRSNSESESAISRPMPVLDSEEDVKSLVRKLGLFPIVIKNAASYLREANLLPGANVSISDYVDALNSAVSLEASSRKGIEEVLGFQEAFSSYPKSMLLVWELSLQMLIRESKEAPNLLELLGFLNRNVSENWIRASATAKCEFQYSDGRIQSLQREPMACLREEMSFIGNRVAFISIVAKLRNLALLSRVYSSSQKCWYLEMHPLIHTWLRCRLADRPAHQAVRFRQAVLLSEFSIGSPFLCDDLVFAKTDGQQLSTAFQGLVKSKDHASDLPIECITFYLFMSLRKYGGHLSFNDTTVGTLVSSVRKQEKMVAELMASLGSSVFHRFGQVARTELDLTSFNPANDDDFGFWTNIQATIDVIHLNPDIFTEQRIQTLWDALAFLICRWWSTIPSLGEAELYAIAEQKPPFEFSIQLSTSLQFFCSFCCYNPDDLLHSVRGAFLAYALCEYLPPEISLALLESHLDPAIHALPALEAIQYFDRLCINLNNFAARKIVGEWGKKAYQTFVRFIGQAHIHDVLYSRVPYGFNKGIFLRDEPQSVYAVHNQRKLRNMHHDLAKLLWAHGLRDEADSVMSHYFLFVGNFTISTPPSADSKSQLPTHWYCIAEDIKCLAAHFIREIFQQMAGTDCSLAVGFTAQLLSGYLTLLRMHFQWISEHDKSSMTGFYEDLPDFEWDNAKSLAAFAQILQMNKRMLSPAVVEAVGDDETWDHLVEQLTHEEVFESLAEFSTTIPYGIILAAASDNNHPLVDWLKDILNPMFQAMYSDAVELAGTAQVDRVVLDKMPAFWVAICTARKELAKREADFHSLENWLRDAENRLPIDSRFKTAPQARVFYCELLQCWEGDMETLGCILAERNLGFNQSYEDLPLSRLLGITDKTEVDSNAARYTHKQLRTIIKTKGDSFFDAPTATWVQFDSNAWMDKPFGSDTIYVVPPPAFYLHEIQDSADNRAL